MSEPVFKYSHVSGVPVSNDELLADLRRLAEKTGRNSVRYDEYTAHGTYSATSLTKRFGSWNNALLRAGLAISKRINVPDAEMFENLLSLWQHYGRQPTLEHASAAPSRFVGSTYARRFGSWAKALKIFVEYANGTGAELTEIQVEVLNGQHKTPRDPSLRLRWRVLQRDNFKCVACGASPAITLGVELHVDHIHPWSEGGETVLENLQTLCSICNLGKANLLPA